MKIMIIQGAGWYQNLVGNVVDVKEETTFFRQENGGPRVEHMFSTRLKKKRLQVCLISNSLSALMQCV
ncbi:hypothetical protein [Bacillus altitudinis]|uniref:hypothetical protein n=1 Tax=Bacillus altitudinis TaxID=293387 RepID=UPI00227FFBA0|nr:hypothetical protein [Bacillus altitudinis]MCY7454308.1 hypothetical protein [Bacillus altitudinis]